MERDRFAPHPTSFISGARFVAHRIPLYKHEHAMVTFACNPPIIILRCATESRGGARAMELNSQPVRSYVCQYYRKKQPHSVVHRISIYSERRNASALRQEFPVCITVI